MYDDESGKMFCQYCLNGPSPEEFVAEKAIIHWVQESQRARRPNFLD